MKTVFQLTRPLAHSLAGLALIAALCPSALAASNDPLELKNGDRVLFIGDTFFEREVDYGQIETRLTAAFPDRNVTFRNLGWAADTPLGRSRASFDWNKPEDEWLKRVKEQVALVKPTVAFLSYGMTASFTGEAGIPKFKADISRLMDAIEEVSGSATDGPNKMRFVLLGPVDRERGSGPESEIGQHNATLVAVGDALRTLAGQRGGQFVDLFDLASRHGVFLQPDGIHLSESGYQPAAERIVAVLTGPLASAPFTEEATPEFELLRAAIRKKNELFFHRWRPENWTYLFGFRKQEQGQNAVEIPRFDPLIEEWEKRIAKLRDLKHQDPATVTEVQGLLTQSRAGLSPARPEQPKADGKSPPHYESQPIPTFEVADGFEVSLWAEDPQLHKPIEVNWDAQGRLWVASSEVYPQIKPGQPATDSIVVLEDTNGDGKADKSTVFADGLLIPTGVLPDSQGGCYVAASHQLLYFKDTNGDGKADERRIVLSSFGTEDTHHNLHTLRWGYDGRIYMNQSIYTHTHVETPHGIARLNSAGIWRFDPYTYQLEVFTRGGCNPWGHHWDNYGNSFFTDGAGFQGISYCVPGAMYFTYAGARRELQSVSPGNYPKFASLEVVRSPQFPDDWQGDFITCDFRAHRVVRFKYSEADAGFQTKEMPDLLRSTNVTFRPIDVKFGPDGGLYIADWSNPIIQHGEVDFRDPRRDKEHGRVWRVTAKGRSTLKREDLTKLGIAELLDRTLSKNGWEQEQARRVAAIILRPRVSEQSADLVRNWQVKQPDKRAGLEALWLNEAVGVFDYRLVKEVLASPDYNVRVAGARYLANNLAPLDHPTDEFVKLCADENSRLRLEALRALSKIPSAKAAELALSVLEKPMDPFLDYALWLTINDLAEPWIAAIKSGEWKVEGHEKQLEFGLKAIEPQKASLVLGQLLGDKPLPQDGRGPWIELIGRAGSPKELQLLFDQVTRRGFDEPAAARALAALSEASRIRNARPPSGREKLVMMFAAPEPTRSEAIRLAGTWKSVGEHLPQLILIAEANTTSPGLRQIAFDSLREIGGRPVIDGLLPLCVAEKPLEIRQKAALALAALDLHKAAPLAVAIVAACPNESDALEFWRSLLTVKGAAAAVGRALPPSGFPAPAAKAGLRVAREGGRSEPELLLALARSAGLDDAELTLTPAEIQQIASSVATQGDPARGEKVFRRPELGCVSCHAIGGVGGKVGPDLTSIGASAPVDYLVESVFYPNRKIKEGYNAVMLETQDGQELSGVLVRENNEQLVIRDVANKEVAIAKHTVRNRAIGGSLMPSGLVDNLSSQERVDLFRFLAELGKPGPYNASKGNVARFWKVRPGTHETEQFGMDRVVGDDLTGGEWQPVYSLVDGSLARDEIQTTMTQNKYAGLVGIFLGAKFQVANTGPARFKLSNAPGVSIWIDGQSIGGTTELGAQLTAGTHTVVLRFDPTKLPEHVRLESADATFLAN